MIEIKTFDTGNNVEVQRGINGMRTAVGIRNIGDVVITVYAVARYFDSTGAIKGTSDLQTEKLNPAQLWNFITTVDKSLASSFALGTGSIEVRVWLTPDDSQVPFKTKVLDQAFNIIEGAAKVPPIGTQLGMQSLFPVGGEQLQKDRLYNFRFKVTNPYSEKWLIHVGMTIMGTSSNGPFTWDFAAKHGSVDKNSTYSNGWDTVLFSPSVQTAKVRMSVWRIDPNPNVTEQDRIGDTGWINFSLL